MAWENEDSQLKTWNKMTLNYAFTSHSSRYLFYNGADPLPSHAPISGLRAQASKWRPKIFSFCYSTLKILSQSRRWQSIAHSGSGWEGKGGREGCFPGVMFREVIMFLDLDFVPRMLSCSWKSCVPRMLSWISVLFRECYIFQKLPGKTVIIREVCIMFLD